MAPGRAHGTGSSRTPQSRQRSRRSCRDRIEGWRILPWFATLVFATAIYNGPRGGLKGCPPFEMLNQADECVLLAVSTSMLGRRDRGGETSAGSSAR